ncbi:hypothetical protein N0V93_005130 [Gnomoniopsis smithogilvyi]|uniref:DUF7726 domain-containing protein n=1 Tax=Gnomoniopsis smithogilvyi TaxID=1191159 RepID=A0A9W8YW03_9PEZI|nr:hypothetical protein N0V93_005130 [Gnomoniopsis smithogilvyi]
MTAMPPPRRALQDASDRINHSPVRQAPIKNTNGDLSQEDVVEVHKGANDLCAILQNPAAVQPVEGKRSTAKPAAGGASKKRKAGPETSLAEDIAAYKQDLSHIDVDGYAVDMNCSQVRTRINQVLDRGIMKKGEFCEAIGSSNKSLNTFLQKRGMDGANTESYTNAWAWFKKRELAGLKMPDVKKRQRADAAATAAGESSASATGPASKKAKTSDMLPDLSHIHLDGEETDSVPVFDTADEIRKKISAHLQKTPGLSQAQFCRDLYAQLKAPTSKGIQSKQLSDFRAKKGARAGCTSTVFYAAYVYFEKLRIARGKPKSAHRTDMEEIYGDAGFDRDNDGRRGYLVLAGETIYEDEYGQVTFSR